MSKKSFRVDTICKGTHGGLRHPLLFRRGDDRGGLNRSHHEESLRLALSVVCILSLGVVHHFHHLHERTDRTLGGRGVGPDVRFFQIIENDDRSTECESTGGLNFARQKLLLALLAFSPTQWLTQLMISMSCFYLLALSPVQCIENRPMSTRTLLMCSVS